MEEKWIDINNYKNLYKISNFGRIKNNKEKILKPTDNGNGYLIIGLRKNGKRKNYYRITIDKKEYSGFKNIEDVIKFRNKILEGSD